MTDQSLTSDEKKAIGSRAKSRAQALENNEPVAGEMAALTNLQHQVGNRVVQRLLAQRSGNGFEIDDQTEARINGARGSGQPLDSAVQAKMSEATGQDFSTVKVHTGAESQSLNEQLSAKAFTTGNDIFFREGAYDPYSQNGQELIAHELTHVVQQSTGAVGGENGQMTVNAPGDAYEQEADSVAKSIMSSGASTEVQRQTLDDEEFLQRVELEEKEDWHD